MLLIRDLRLTDFRIADGLLGDTLHIESPNSLPCHRPDGCAALCDELGDPPFAHTIGNAIHLAPKLHGRAVYKPQAQASSGAAWHGSQSKRRLDVLEELPYLWFWKAEDQPSQ